MCPAWVSAQKARSSAARSRVDPQRQTTRGRRRVQSGHRHHRRTRGLCSHVPTTRSRGGRRALWAFGYDDLAALLGVTTRTARRMVRTGAIDPADLEQLTAAWEKRRSQS